MLTSTIVISGLVFLGVGGFFVYSKFKNKKSKIEKEIVIPYTRPTQERIQFSKVSHNIKTTPISTSTTKQTKTPSKTIHSHNTYNDDLYPIYHDYGSNSHNSSHDSHSSYDSGSSDSGNCDCGGCD